MGSAMSMCGQKVSPVTNVGCEKAPDHDGPHGVLFGASPVTSPRTPRQWNAGDPEPEDRPVLRDHAPGAGFVWETPLQREGIWGNDYGQWMPWAKVLEHYGRLSEVLPETPEPPREDPVPLEIYAKHQYNTRQMREPGQLEDLCTCGEWVSDWLEHHAEEAAKLASQSVPAVPVSSTGGKETGEAAETATEALNARKILLQLLQQVHDAATDDEPLNLRDAADRFLAGWRPTPPDSETEWGIRPVGQGDVEETGTEEWARSVAARMPALYVAVSRRLAGPWVEVTS